MSSVPTFSLEFFPPKDEAGESRLWGALEELAEYAPDFVSVTYGAGGSTRDRTVRVTSEITSRTGVPTIAHLTCVGSTRSELQSILHQYSEAGINSILALRGDPQGGPSAAWVKTPGGLDHADELVTMACELDFEVGVAAFPDGHPASNGNLVKDIEVLLEKERRGASFATTQFFFDSTKYFSLVERLRAAGSNLSIYPGILPITNMAQLRRMAELSGTPIPEHVSSKFAGIENDSSAVKETGVEIATQLCRELLQGEVPGLHFYTMNSAASTIKIIKEIGLR